MSPSKKKKGKHRRPPPRYRKLAKGGTPRATDAPTRDAATVPEAVGSIPSHAGPDRRGPSTVVSLEPLAPIIVRSGRPMHAHTDADPPQFPPPSTVAGCVRTTWARATGRPFGSALAELRVAGPLLLSGDGRILAPKPADALYFGHDDGPRCVRTAPQRFHRGCDADLPDGLLPVRLLAQVEGKPADGPAWWSWDDLLAFRRGESVPLDQLTRNGWSPPPEGDLRTHVSIDPSTGAAVSRNLFQTEGLDLDVYPAAFRTHAPGSARADGLEASDTINGESLRGRRLLVRCVEALDATLVHLGGKRRLAALEPECRGAVANTARRVAGPDRTNRRSLPDAGDTGDLLGRLSSRLAGQHADGEPARRPGGDAAPARRRGRTLATTLRLGSRTEPPQAHSQAGHGRRNLLVRDHRRLRPRRAGVALARQRLRRPAGSARRLRPCPASAMDAAD